MPLSLCFHYVLEKNGNEGYLLAFLDANQSQD
jgi:hypothetical protein